MKERFRTLLNPSLTQYKLFPKIHITKPLIEKTDYDTVVDAEDEGFIFGDKPVVRKKQEIRSLRQAFLDIRQSRINERNKLMEHLLQVSARKFNKTFRVQKKEGEARAYSTKRSTNRSDRKKMVYESRRNAKSSKSVHSKETRSKAELHRKTNRKIFKPCYEYCVICNDKNIKYLKEMKGISVREQVKLREEWNKEFIKDFS
eukprot:TRINITY_DN12421_c0_g1_i1.p1 TRINITY_DN12421_c0_g1~~TRINITY_DN12421_c0_g1_i1.p1  ORF type:complete len:202 (-),score=45.17 TRINITY_DN12421_c0_g1_i1:133-738(-)